jgi:hypothetical protein
VPALICRMLNPALRRSRKTSLIFRIAIRWADISFPKIGTGY